MKSLSFERSFRSWAGENGVRWERFSYPRGSGMTVAYRLTPPAPPRATVVAVHGAGNDALFGFVGLFKHCLERGLQVFTFDVDGHGRDSTTTLSARSVRGAVAQAVERSGAPAAGRPVHLVGVSFGAALALSELPDLEDRVASVAALVPPRHIEFSRKAVLNEIGRTLLFTVWREREHYGLTGLIPSFGPFRRGLYPLRLERSGGGGFGYIAELNDILAALDPLAAARAAETPILLAYGAEDRLVPASQGELLARGPRRELLTVEGGTHLSTPYHPDVQRRLVSWLEEHSPKGAASAG